ncbi:enoyl-CoA hydratase-related protein [uncultured Pseudomonas sp.]|uniref:enoyl-CoA hydratase-related protein n=1 Tax=uncultured Pseudomonas sp. TaxID=114707 RepID=UPI0025D4A797|nr:enoyl-CoA hydratase-related protein [uncultured Pseudomonas sp.]
MQNLTLEIDNGVAWVTLDRPPVNAITLAHYQAIGELFDALGENPAVNCAVFTAAGERAFCAGLDLHEFLAAKVEDDPARAAVVRQCFASVRRCPIPVIAAVNGPALGAGTVLATVCDIRLASTRASFSMPEINVGRCGGGAHLGRLIGQGNLRKLFFTGQPIGAAEALRIGLVEEVVAPEALRARAEELARLIASKSPLGLRLGKASLNEIEDLPVEEGYRIEQGYSTRLMATEDAREATRAVVEKRAPVFVGR